MGTERALAVAQLPGAGGHCRCQTQDPLMPEPWKAKAGAGQELGMSRAASSGTTEPSQQEQMLHSALSEEDLVPPHTQPWRSCPKLE